MKWLNWLFLGVIVILAILSPILALFVGLIYLRFRFREFFWRLSIAKWIFVGVLILGLVLSQMFNGLLAWLF